MEAIQFFLKDVKLGGKQTHPNMTLFPLLTSDAGEPDYLIRKAGQMPPGHLCSKPAEMASTFHVRIPRRGFKA